MYFGGHICPNFTKKYHNNLEPYLDKILLWYLFVKLGHIHSNFHEKPFSPGCWLFWKCQLHIFPIIKPARDCETTQIMFCSRMKSAKFWSFSTKFSRKIFLSRQSSFSWKMKAGLHLMTHVLESFCPVYVNWRNYWVLTFIFKCPKFGWYHK